MGATTRVERDDQELVVVLPIRFMYDFYLLSRVGGCWLQVSRGPLELMLMDTNPVKI